MESMQDINTSSNSRWNKITKENVSSWLYKYRWPLSIFAISIVMGIVMFIYRKELFQGLEILSEKLKDMGTGGYVLMSTLIFLSAFPPIIGYATYQTLSGYTFGFEVGFAISYFSALVGAVSCFFLCRKLVKERVSHMLSKYPNLEAVVKAVEKKGFKLFLLIRLSPYPFNLLNIFFATTDMSLFQFAAGTALSLLKIALHIYIGANLTSFAKMVLGDEEELSEKEQHVQNVRYFSMALGFALTFGVMAYIYHIAKKVVKEVSLEEENNDESLAFLGETRDEEDPSSAEQWRWEMDSMESQEPR
ncbi:hypothetical protein K501DRAFT_259041 [Backusella circina FSU 941]|nr:hypothetical protein K501DRAFT_259041 [Backusella circina FSU 941]